MKLVLSDLDGTLLKKGEAALPSETFEMIRWLHGQGILFAVASGRNDHELFRLFEPVAEQMAFICLDGALVVEGEQVLYSRPLPNAAAQQLLFAARQKPHQLLLFSGRGKTWFWTDEERLAERVTEKYGAAAVRVDSIAEECGGIYKVMHYGAPLAQPPNSAGLSAVYDGETWQEWVARGVDKGAAVRFLQKKLGIRPAECMAFGDADNDIGMLRQVGCRFAMKNSSQRVLAMCDRQAERVETTVMDYLAERRRV